MKFYIILAALFSFFFFTSVSLATPFLHDYSPLNNTFISGGVKIFSVNITSASLNSSTPTLYIISQNAFQNGEPWDTYQMTCSNSGSEWNCAKTLSFAIVGSDTVEYFYFRANDTDGSTATNGTATNSIVLTLDRNPPSISYKQPLNNTWVHGNQTVSITVTDSASGVDNTSVQFSTDNSTWTTMSNISQNNFVGYLNTLPFSNNQTITIYTRASDKVRNNATSWINATVDNELPAITIISPSPTTYSGVIQLTITVNDIYSGINTSTVNYFISNKTSLLCSGNANSATCTNTFDTSSLVDGNYTITFSATDIAGNMNNVSINITTANQRPFISVTSPSANSYTSGVVNVTVGISNNPKNIIQYVTTSLQGSGVNTLNNMTCSSDFSSCQYSLNTLSFSDGKYTLKLTGVNSLGLDVSTSIPIYIDNQAPVVGILSPTTSTVRGSFNIQYSVTDDLAVDGNSGTFTIGGSPQPIGCSVQLPAATTMICSMTFNSNQLSDGQYTIQMNAKDKAGNSASASKTVTVGNKGPYVSFIKIDPLTSTNPTNITFTVGLNDNNGNVVSAKLIATSDTIQKIITLTQSGNAWIAKSFFELGAYKVGINATDDQGLNTLSDNVGYFYIGQSQCGDGICQSTETYCTCPSDCARPTCGQNIECGSGYAQCVGSTTCGDKLCYGSETCSSCAIDCGSCIDFQNLNSSEQVSKFGEPKSPGGFQLPNIPISQTAVVWIVIGLVVIVAVVMAFLVKRGLGKNIITD